MQESESGTKSTASISKWVQLYSDNLFSWALHKTSSKETAEDLVQETFLAAVQSFEKFKGNSNPKTWLFAILNNKINDFYRSCYRKQYVNEELIVEHFFGDTDHWKKEEAPKEWADETGHLLDDSEFQKAFHHCMKKLPGNWFSAIQLKFMEEKSGEHICQELEITPTNFWQMLHRAKLQLRKCLELNWFKK